MDLIQRVNEIIDGAESFALRVRPRRNVALFRGVEERKSEISDGGIYNPRVAQGKTWQLIISQFNSHTMKNVG